jgi:hypothetical protein
MINVQGDQASAEQQKMLKKFDMKGIVLHEFVPPNITVNYDFCSDIF